MVLHTELKRLSRSINLVILKGSPMKASRTSLLVGPIMIMVAESTCASMSFDVVGDVLVDRSTGFAWRQVIQTGFPSTTALGDGWNFASWAAIDEMLPDLGVYAGVSDVARAMAFFDPSSLGYVGGWFTHGTNAAGLPVFDGSSYHYSIGSDGTISTQGWGVSTIGDYSASQCVPPYPAPPFENFCNTPRAFFVLNATLPSPVPLPSSSLLLCGGLAFSRLLARRKSVAGASSCATGSVR